MSEVLANAKQHWDAIAPVDSALQSAMTAYNLAYQHPSVRDRADDLGADLRTVRRQATLLRNPSHGQPDYKAELKLWQDAEKRWLDIAKRGMAPRQLLPDPMATARHRDQAAAHIRSLAGLGVQLSVTEAGELVARPSALLRDHDRQRLRENRPIIIELLKQEEKL